jgi:hypothetical protein
MSNASGSNAERMWELNRVSAERRRARSEARRAMQSQGREGLIAVLRDPPAALADEPILDVLRHARRSRAQPSLERLNQAAVFAGINLMVPLGSPRAVRARAWAADRGLANLPYVGPARTQ